jgi:hypothetical protein
MKRIVGTLLIVALAGIMLLPVSPSVNNSLSNGNVVADNGGVTPPWPPSRVSSLQVSISQV